VDLIQDGVNGILAQPADTESLAAGLERLIDQPELRQRLAGNARSFVGREFSIETTSDAIGALYERLLRPQRGQLVRPPTPNPKVLRIITRLNIGGPAVHTILLSDGLKD